MNTAQCAHRDRDAPPTPPDIRVRIRRFGWSKQAQIKYIRPAGFYLSGTLPTFQRPLHYVGKNMLFDNHDHLPKPFGLGTVRAFIGVRPPGILLPFSGGPARFHRLLCPLLTSATRSPPLTVRSVRCRTSRQISRGEHASFRT
jgi:hypothetical protein